MNLKGISHYLGLSCYPVAFLSFFNILYSSYFDHFLNLNSYIITLFASIFFGISFFLIGKNSNRDIKFYEQLFLILIIYLVISFLISIPYYLSNYQLTFIDSYFESVSGLTATGFSIFDNIKFLDPTLILWRSSSQWIGGLFFLIFIVLIFSSFKNDYKLTNLVYNPDKATNLYKNFDKVIYKVFFIYIFFSIIIFFLLSFSGVRLFNGFNFTMTIVSTGGFLPTNSLAEIIKTNFQKILLIFLFILSTLNIYFFYSILFSKKNIKKHYEDITILTVIFALFVVAFLIVNKINILDLMIGVLSSINNSGLSIVDPPKNLNLFFIFLTIIGGSVLSNTSGIKIIRLYILLKSSIIEIFKLVTPNIVIDQRILKTDFKINTDVITSSFLIFISFFISLLILSSILITDNFNFEESFKLSILTLTNTLNSFLYGNEDIQFRNMLISSKISIILFMIIGKIELISFFLIIKKIFNRN